MYKRPATRYSDANGFHFTLTRSTAMRYKAIHVRLDGTTICGHLDAQPVQAAMERMIEVLYVTDEFVAGLLYDKEYDLVVKIAYRDSTGVRDL